MGRKILYITSDQQRYDAYGCNGGAIARTPNVDALAAAGTSFSRCNVQSVVCMPSRATMLTGQHVSTHGVWMNGVQVPVDAPSVAQVLKDAGYKTALIGKSHFDPFVDPFLAFPENTLASQSTHDPLRGFDHLELAAHSGTGWLHYASSLRAEHPTGVGMFYPVLDATLNVNGLGGGDTGAPQVHVNALPREWYHTDWIAQRSVTWLNALPEDEDWFLWVSFPDPHHPWDPPASETHRVNWRDLDLPEGYIADSYAREAVLDAKPRQWSKWYNGELVANYEAPPAWVPKTLTADQVREVNAMVHIENELIDEAIGSIMTAVRNNGWDNDTDVFVSADHGELQGDFGLLFKGPYHVDGLMRVPMIWRPAPSAGLPVAKHISDPVGLVDLAPTFCSVAGVPVSEWMEGSPFPKANGDPKHQRVLTEWDSALFGVEMALRTMYRDGWVITTYLPGTIHDGTEGELYNLIEDPLQHINRFDDLSSRSIRDDLIADLRASIPASVPPGDRKPVVAPV
jgi:arylsulfatase A-like enzyme